MKYILLDFLNYNNRQLRRYTTVDDYKSYGDVKAYSEILTVRDFPYNDYVNTNFTVRVEKANTFNYFLLLNDDLTIDSRWYILNSGYLSKERCTISLRRDIIADYLHDLAQTPFVFSKFPISDDNPQIFNDEPIAYNKVKKAELPIEQVEDLEWIVGYIPKDAFKEGSSISITRPSLQTPYKTYDTMESFYSSWYYKKLIDKVANYNAKRTLGFLLNSNAYTQSYFLMNNNDVQSIQLDVLNNKGDTVARKFTHKDPVVNILTNKIDGEIRNLDGTTPEKYRIDSTDGVKKANTVKEMNVIISSQPDLFNPYGLTDDEYTELKNLGGKIFKIGSATYEISVTELSGFTTQVKDDANYGAVAELIHSALEDSTTYFRATNADNYFVEQEGKIFNAKLIETYDTINVNIPAAAERTSTENSTYNLFAIPYSSSASFIYEGEESLEHWNSTVGIWVAPNITAQLGSGTVYDIQKVPYCSTERFAYVGTPRSGSVKKITDKITVRFNSAISVITTPITSNNETISRIYWLKDAEGHFDIDLKIPATGLQTTKKLSSMLDTYRVVSPQYQSIFEFSPAKNDGVDNFHIDFTLKPWKPYFKIAPNFKGLYGQNFEDSRGCILSDDFSLPQLSSSWGDYVQNTKNYQNIFDREIQTMDRLHVIDQTKQVVSSIAGASGAAVNGAIAGGVGGAVAAGTTSLAAGIIDTALDEQTYQISKQLKKDIFNYQLDNIKAVPQSLSKAASFNYNTRSCPFVEVLSGTDEDVIQAENYIKYNGCSVNYVGVLEFDSEWNFYSGQILRHEGSMTTPVYNALNEEFGIGIYINDIYI